MVSLKEQFSSVADARRAVSLGSVYTEHGTETGRLLIVGLNSEKKAAWITWGTVENGKVINIELPHPVEKAEVEVAVESDFTKKMWDKLNALGGLLCFTSYGGCFEYLRTGEVLGFGNKAHFSDFVIATVVGLLFGGLLVMFAGPLTWGLLFKGVYRHELKEEKLYQKLFPLFFVYPAVFLPITFLLAEWFSASF